LPYFFYNKDAITSIYSGFKTDITEKFNENNITQLLEEEEAEKEILRELVYIQ